MSKTDTLEQQEQKVFEYLDGYHFVETAEIQMAIADYFRIYEGMENPSYGDLMHFDELADKYMDERDMDYLEDSMLNGGY